MGCTDWVLGSFYYYCNECKSYDCTDTLYSKLAFKDGEIAALSAELSVQKELVKALQEELAIARSNRPEGA